MEGGTFHTTALAAIMRDKVVESRLHMDAPNEIDPARWPLHERVRDELIGRPGAPYYAIVDPASGEFLFRINGIPGGDYEELRKTFLSMFESLPAKQEKA